MNVPERASYRFNPAPSTAIQTEPSSVPASTPACGPLNEFGFSLSGRWVPKAANAGEYRSVRYRSRIVDARRRIAAADRLLRAAIDDVELLDEIVTLSDWLGCFADESWLELDYAGIARFLGDELASDQSARDIHRALDAMRREDFAAAGEAYRAFQERWRAVNAFERAN